MTISLDSLAAEVAALRVLNGRDECDLTSAELHDFHDGLGRIRKSYDAVAATMAGEVTRRSAPELGAGGLARREGFSNPQQYLANTLGTTPTEANKLIDASRALAPHVGGQDDLLGSTRLEDGRDWNPDINPDNAPAPAPLFPYVANALRAGAIGADAASVITRTLESIANAYTKEDEARTKDHGSHLVGPATAEVRDERRRELAKLESRLVEKASSLTLAELRKACERDRAWRFPKELAVKERVHREGRALFFHEDPEGMTVMTARMDAASAAPIKAFIDAQTRWAFHQRRSVKDGGSGIEDPRTAGQIRMDALASLAQHGLGCERSTTGIKTTVVVRINEQDLRDDLALGDCDQLPGPITVGTLRLMAVDAGILPVVLGGKSLPLDVGRKYRRFTPAQRIAIEERDGGCSWCHAPPSFCEAHHIVWWQFGGRSDLSNGVMLCTRCHHRVHNDGWTVEVDGDQVWITKPGQPDRGRQGPAATRRLGGKAHLELDRVES